MSNVTIDRGVYTYQKALRRVQRITRNFNNPTKVKANSKILKNGTPLDGMRIVYLFNPSGARTEHPTVGGFAFTLWWGEDDSKPTTHLYTIVPKAGR